ncbi:long-chain fatty acid--CoA ligase [Oceanobacillus sp. J11TS1]|uniref:long-chain fatty acid--CoA ligase n=1 Tax=Oceanobacillus sp. J11TS1 TaxID=2807191 RepID=UPI001B2EFED0|nr:long-chain fatty acid--CoA ligase [Oceanobacillus sp. J11TS1]GIO22569.1 long-chain-fatty-acid--CoA ligase [Oceanobacillus sp. J11TS1]
MFTRHFEHWPRLPKTLVVPETTVYQNLEVSAQRYPNQRAIHYYGNDLSYKQLDEEVNVMAGYLQKRLGIKRGEKVLLFMQNSPQFVIAYYAILRADAVVVPINSMLKGEELEFYVNDCEIRNAIIGQELYDRISPLIETTSLEEIIIVAYSEYMGTDFNGAVPAEAREEKKLFFQSHLHPWKECIEARLLPDDHVTGPDDLIVLPYTSGTTGLPKGCMHTNKTVQANTFGGFYWARGTASNVHLATLPFFHVTGMVNSMHAPILSGSTIVILTRWNRDTAVELIESQKCTNWITISTMLVDFLANPDLDPKQISSLTSISGGGAALPEAVGEKLYKLTGLKFLEGYGLSETIAQTHSNPVDRPKMQCLGIPSFDVDSRIIDPLTHKELSAGEVGEIVVRGPQIMVGYYNREKENESAFIEIEGQRFFRTGDIGRFDEEGYFFIVDRVKRMINASGFKVWPTEIESFLYKHPAVQQACVVGVPDPRRGETIKAFIILNDDYKGKISDKEIIEWSKERMASYKYPRIIEFRETLPTTSSGKILWRKLQHSEWEKAQS